MWNQERHLLYVFCQWWLQVEFFIIQVIIFAVPCFLYYGIKSGKINYPMLKWKIGGNTVVFFIASFGVMICGSLLLQLMFYMQKHTLN